MQAFVVPQYLTALVAEKAPGRPSVCRHVPQCPLPADGMTVNISRITTASTAAAQASENAAISETDIDDTLLTANVRTYAGQQDISRQVIERGTMTEDIIFRGSGDEFTPLPSMLTSSTAPARQAPTPGS